MLKGKSVLVTGGTGSFGKSFVRRLLGSEEVRRVVVLSRDELKQSEMAAEPVFQDRRLKFFLGDVRDRERLLRAFEDVEVVIHAAALKQVPAAEYNPFEAIKTNVLGAQNVIDAAMTQGVKRVVALSTDKAAAPVNLYGATKLCSDKLFVAANNFKGHRDIRLSVVRYGNVMGSRGSVIPFFLRQRRTGTLPITDERMTRFSITLGEGVDLVLHAIEHMWGGETFVAKLPSYRITDLANAIAPKAKHEIVGLRPGEKIHEEMVTKTDALNTLDCGPRYVILPSMPMYWSVEDFAREMKGTPCPDGFEYNSGSNDDWLSVEKLRELVVEHVDPSFRVE